VRFISALLRLLPRSDRDKDVELPACCPNRTETTVSQMGPKVDRPEAPQPPHRDAYLRHGRPRVLEVFLSLDAPVSGIGYMAVSSIVRRGCERAGLPPRGGHRLRHTLGVAHLCQDRAPEYRAY